MRGFVSIGSRPIDIFIRWAPADTSVRVMNQTMCGWMTGNLSALMFENTPRIVCLPVPGSMWTASHRSHASSCGLEFTLVLSTGARVGGALGAAAIHFARAPAAPNVGRARFARPVPPLFVVACSVLAAAGVLWLLVWLPRAAFYLLFVSLLVA